MTKPAQAKLAGWTLMCAAGSFTLPLLALLVLGGAGSISAFWFKCAGLLMLAAISFWVLSKSAENQFGYPAFCWLMSLIYFATVLVAIASAFQSPELVAVLCIPEVAGLILSFVGLGHLIYLRRQNA